MDEQSTTTLADDEILTVTASETMPGDDGDADGTDVADTDADDSDSDADDTGSDSDGTDAA
ncbi:MAG: hypothetical protein H0T61_02685 [Actinobacteria bacterium]|nr:hypothetical protein [Actinomycetota bacterium]